MSENKKTNQIQPPEELVLCGASAYNQKFYINENFKNLPDEIKNQLKVMCVLFCADITFYRDKGTLSQGRISRADLGSL